MANFRKFEKMLENVGMCWMLSNVFFELFREMLKWLNLFETNREFWGFRGIQNTPGQPPTLGGLQRAGLDRSLRRLGERRFKLTASSAYVSLQAISLRTTADSSLLH